jgi:molybdopterin/thiamine biosynthesis adenylyltransferase
MPFCGGLAIPSRCVRRFLPKLGGAHVAPPFLQRITPMRAPARATYLELATRSPYLGLMDMNFSEDEISRYSRHILLREVGGIGQARLRAGRVLVVGAGGLGSPLALYLAAAGVGTIGIVDDDRVELSNLQRQIAHATARIGAPKATSAAEAATAINPDVRIEPHHVRLDVNNAPELIARYDIVCDGTDNFATRFLVADACVLGHRTLVSAAVLRFEGQLSTFKPHLDVEGPCYRCLYPEPPPPGTVPTCSEAGVLGAVTGVMGTLQATETLKEILGIGDSLSGRLLIWDALAARFRMVRLRRDLGCALCGPKATITQLSHHVAKPAATNAL